MTAPYTGSTQTQQPQWGARPRRQRTGATGSPGGDGNYDANGVSRPPGAQGMTGEATQPSGAPPQAGGGSQTSAPGQPQPHYGAQHQPASMTFAQMQSQGMARPNPPSADINTPTQNGGSLGGQLQQSVSQALATPSRYDLPQVQQTRDALTAQLAQQFGGQRKQLDEAMAQRGLGASTIGSGYYGDLAGQQDTAMANMNSQLLQNYAATQAQDLSASLGAGQNYQNAQNSNSIAQQGLGLQAGELTGNYNGQQTLGAQQLAQSGSQFDKNYNLQSQLGLGGLDLQKQQLAQSGTQFDKSHELQSQLGLGNLGVQQQQVANQNTQFGQSLALQQAQQDLNKQVQLGQLTLGQANEQLAELTQKQQNAYQTAQLGQQGSQFDKTFGLQSDAQKAQQQQFSDQLAQQLNLGTMSDKTANRGVDAQEALSKNDLLMKLMGIMGNFDWSKFAPPTDKKTSTTNGNGNGGDTGTDHKQGTDTTDPNGDGGTKDSDLQRQIAMLLSGMGGYG